MKLHKRLTITLILLGTLGLPACKKNNNPLPPNPGGNGDTYAGKFVLAYDGDVARSITTQPDGKLVVSTTQKENPTAFAVRRYDRDVNLDTSFGIGGKALSQLGSKVVAQSDGLVLGGDYDCGSSNPCLRLGRLDRHGDRDTSFGAGGTIDTPFRVNKLYGYSAPTQVVGVDGSDNIYYGGNYLGETTGSYKRLNPNGSNDPSYPRVAIPQTNFTMLAVLSDGRTRAGSIAQSVFGITNMGTTDYTFGSGGQLAAQIPRVQAIAADLDNRLIVAGIAFDTPLPDGSKQIVVERYLENGTIDSSFGTNGRVQTGLGSASEEILIAIEDDNRVLIAGSSYTTTRSATFVRRFDQNGTPDATFLANTSLGFTKDRGESVAGLTPRRNGGFAVLLKTTRKPMVPGEYAEDGFALAVFSKDGELLNPDRAP